MLFIKGLQAALTLLTVFCNAPTDAIFPKGVVELKNTTMYETIPCAPAFHWTVSPPKKGAAVIWTQLAQPEYHDGCSWSNDSSKVFSSKTILLDRGNCTFLEKAFQAQRLNATAVIVRNTRRSIYENDIMQRNMTSEFSPFAFDCSNGESYKENLNYEPWETDSLECSNNVSCASKQCLPTGIHNVTKGGYQLCCIWDTFTLMGANATRAKSLNLNIPVVMVTVREGRTLEDAALRKEKVLMYLLPRPIIHASSILIWLLAIFTVIISAYSSAASERSKAYNTHIVPADSNIDDHEFSSSDQLRFEFTAFQAIGLIGISSSFLLLLYFVPLGPILSVFYALCSVATFTAVIGHPLIDWVFPRLKYLGTKWVTKTGVFENLSELFGAVFGAILATTWYVSRHHDSCAWVLQDIFGICLCISFLRIIHLPNLKVASLLLCMAFIYDIFFVFISPLVFGTSVMVEVASGGERPQDRMGWPGIDYCERYPKDVRCIPPEAVPMMLSIPNVGGYLGGSSLLGIGDIVLPGLLIAFALRVDYSTYDQTGSALPPLWHGYYSCLCCGYAIGLLLANLAVQFFELGQPALLYLVPCTLGPMLVRAKRNGEFASLWDGSVLSSQVISRSSSSVECKSLDKDLTTSADRVTLLKK